MARSGPAAVGVTGDGRARDLFAVPRHIAYFNTANLAPLLNDVVSAGRHALDARSHPWRISAEDWFTDVETLRDLIGSVVGDNGDGVALVPSTSYGMATAAANLPLSPGHVIVVLDDEYPSGIYTWRRHARRHGAHVHTVRRAPDLTWAEAITADLERLADRVAILSVPQVHWTNGAWVDLGSVVPHARRLGAAVVLDLSQSLGVVETKVDDLDVDFAVSVGYKWMLGPFGRAYLWVGHRHRSGIPLEENWIVREGASDFAGLTDYTERYQQGARRFDQGQRTAFEITPMAVAATRQLIEWGIPALRQRIAQTSESIEAIGSEHGLAMPHGPRAPHIVAFTLTSDQVDHAARALDEHQVFASVRNRSLRIAPHVHNDEVDLERLSAALATIGR